MKEKIVKESLDDLHKFKYDSIYGYIDYDYLVSMKYPEGLLVLNGSIVYKEWRRQGKFKEMLKTLLSKFPEGTIVQAAVISKKLTSMFERIGFERVDKIEHWGSPANCTLLQGIINKNTLNLIN